MEESEKLKKKEYDEKYSKDNKEKINKEKKIKYYDNIETSRERGRDYYHNNKEKVLQKQKEKWKLGGKEKIKERRKNDPIFKLKGTMSNRIRIFMKSKGLNKRNKRTFDIVGCEPIFLKKYLENKFKEGMNWDNHGEWHIDHIIPLDLASTEEEVYVLNHYTNLQPLWKSENLSKGCKI